MRLTTHRREILDYLHTTVALSSARDLHTALPHINLVTIYRALEYLVKERAITKVALDSGEAYYEDAHEPHYHAICTVCGEVIHFITDTATLLYDLGIPGFSATELDLVVRGTCTHHALHKKQRPQTKKQK